VLALLLCGVFGNGGCYLGHLAAGQWRLLRARQPIAVVLSDPAAPADLKQQLEAVRAARAFAIELGLSVDGNYTSYAPWPGDRVVTSVVATRPGEVEAAGFWFPLLGRLPYKGYFDPGRAAREAERLRGQGLDVCEVPVPAYSTLGWFDDPVTGPMLRIGEGWLVETLLHELVHLTVYLREQADFNEGVASFVGEEASVRFYARAGREAEAARRRLEVEEGRRVDALVLGLRERVQALYAEAPPGAARAEARARLEVEARAEAAALPLATRDAAQLAERLRLNDACLALAATYTADLPLFAARLETLDGDLAAFVARLREAAEAEDPREHLLAPAPRAPRSTGSPPSRHSALAATRTQAEPGRSQAPAATRR
jgi:predicted aminopeptidase